MTTDSYIRVQYLKTNWSEFKFLSYFLCHVTLKLAVSRRPQKVSSISMKFGL